VHITDVLHDQTTVPHGRGHGRRGHYMPRSERPALLVHADEGIVRLWGNSSIRWLFWKAPVMILNELRRAPWWVGPVR